MSELERPNLHAVGLSIDIFDALQKRVRGKAASANMGKLMEVTQDLVVKFVNEVDDALDREFGV